MVLYFYLQWMLVLKHCVAFHSISSKPQPHTIQINNEVKWVCELLYIKHTHNRIWKAEKHYFFIQYKHNNDKYLPKEFLLRIKLIECNYRIVKLANGWITFHGLWARIYIY